MEALCRSLHRNRVSVRRIKVLASLSAKFVQRRFADLWPGHFPERHGQRFLPIRRAPLADSERRERESTEQLRIFREKRTDSGIERFLDRGRSFQGRDRLQAGGMGGAFARRLQLQLHLGEREQRARSRSARPGSAIYRKTKRLLLIAGSVRRN